MNTIVKMLLILHGIQIVSMAILVGYAIGRTKRVDVRMQRNVAAVRALSDSIRVRQFVILSNQDSMKAEIRALRIADEERK